jgi:uncharacterized coiled-coil DUF342 family protein
MARRPIATHRSWPGARLVRRKTVSELEQAEIKLQSLLEKRDALNREAQLLREERDLVQAKKREVGDRLRVLRDRRWAFAEEARAHRRVRDELQGKAKTLIDVKRKIRSFGPSDVGAELRALARRVAAMEMRQQTTTLSLSKENELLDELKESVRRMKVLQGAKAEQDKIVREVRDLDGEITGLFQAADKEHETAVALSGKARAVHEETLVFLPQVSALEAEGAEKHQGYLDARTKADEVHAKVVEMRDKVLTIKGAQRAEVRESRDLLRAQNRSVRVALLDERKLEATADAALRALLERGKVEIGR